MSEKTEALATHLKVSEDDITEERNDTYSHEGAEYLVLTDYEADQALSESLDNYLDECVYPGLPAVAVQYFDQEAWKRDAVLSDGRGHSLSPYDGEEHEVKIDGTWYYIYRVN